MNTTILSKEKNVNYHIKLFHLLVIAFGFVVLTGISGCFDSGSDDPVLDTGQSKPGTGGSVNTPSNHTDNVNNFLHAPGKYAPYTNWCTACHGADLTGDKGPSCTTCHDPVWSENALGDKGGLFRLYRDQLDIRVLLFQVSPCTAYCPTGAQCGNQNIDLPFGLLPELRPGVEIMGFRVRGVDMLADIKIVRVFLQDLFHALARPGRA
ncbi:hypothetical protein, partial [Kaarinaea lacus]